MNPAKFLRASANGIQDCVLLRFPVLAQDQIALGSHAKDGFEISLVPLYRPQPNHFAHLAPTRRFNDGEIARLKAGKIGKIKMVELAYLVKANTSR
jgi:hypothetical protein